MEKVYKDLSRYFKKVSKESGISIDDLLETRYNDEPFDFKDEQYLAWALAEKLGKLECENRGLFSEIELIDFSNDDFDIYRFGSKFIKVDYIEHDYKLTYVKSKLVKEVKIVNKWIELKK